MKYQTRIQLGSGFWLATSIIFLVGLPFALSLHLCLFDLREPEAVPTCLRKARRFNRRPVQRMIDSVFITISHFTGQEVALLESLAKLSGQLFQLFHVNSQTGLLLVQPALKRGQGFMLESPFAPVMLRLKPSLECCQVGLVVH